MLFFFARSQNRFFKTAHIDGVGHELRLYGDSAAVRRVGFFSLYIAARARIQLNGGHIGVNFRFYSRLIADNSCGMIAV